MVYQDIIKGLISPLIWCLFFVGKKRRNEKNNKGNMESFIMVVKKNKKRKDEMINSIKETLNKFDAKLILFEYFFKIFGNIVIEIKYKGKKHVFVFDIGEIRHNQELVFRKSIWEDGHYDPF